MSLRRVHSVLLRGPVGGFTLGVFGKSLRRVHAGSGAKSLIRADRLLGAAPVTGLARLSGRGPHKGFTLLGVEAFLIWG